MIKYLILDMGKVLVAPTSGDWFITNEFLKNVDMSKFSKEELKDAIEQSRHFLNEKVTKLDEEYIMISNFYKSIFNHLNYKIDKENLENIVNNFVYDKGESKYELYKNVKEELEILSKKYTVLMLSDNWPCAYNYLKKYDIEDYFKKIYISSEYGVTKQDKVFFDYPINDFNIQKGEALFIDDNEDLLDIAVEKGMKVLHMDRNNKIDNSKYQVIHDFSGLI